MSDEPENNDVIIEDETPSTDETPTDVDLSFMLDGRIPDGVKTEGALTEEDEKLLGISTEAEDNMTQSERLHPDNIDLMEGTTVAEKLRLRRELGEQSEPTPEPEPESDLSVEPSDTRAGVKVTISEDTPPASDTAPPQAQPPAPEPSLPAQEEPQDESFLTKEEQDFIASLDEDDRETLEFWEYAERSNPEKHKGGFDKAFNFMVQKAQKRHKILEEDPEADVDNDHTLNDWVEKNKPQVSAGEARRIQQRRVIDIAKQEIRQEESRKFSAIEKRQMQIEKAPIVQQKYQEFNTLANAVIPQDMQDVMVKANSEGKDASAELAASHGAETNVVANHYQPLLEMGSEFIKLTEGTADIDPHNPLHMQINEKIKAYGQMMLANPKMKQALVNDKGQSFSPREVYNKMPPAEKQKHWTLSNQQILTVMVNDAKRKAEADLSEHRKQRHSDEVKTLMSVGFSKQDAEKKIAERTGVARTPPAQQKNREQKPTSTPVDDESPKATPRRSGNGEAIDSSAESSSGVDTFLTAPMDSDNYRKVK